MSAWPAAVLFDFDGVIVDSEPLHCRAFQEVLLPHGIELSETEYYRDLIGFDDRGALTRIFEMRRRPLDAEALRQLIREKNRMIMEVIRREGYEAMPGAAELVRKLAERCALGICSGALRDEIEGMLRGVGLRALFRVIVSAEDVTVGKPDPQGYLMTARQLGEQMRKTFAPSDCLVIEDAPTVAKSARQAGFRVLAVATTYPMEKLTDADWAVASLHPPEVLRAVPELAASLST